MWNFISLQMHPHVSELFNFYRQMVSPHHRLINQSFVTLISAKPLNLFTAVLNFLQLNDR